MVEVKEFRNVQELNLYFKDHKLEIFEVIPIARMFENPQTKLLTSTMTYVLVVGR